MKKYNTIYFGSGSFAVNILESLLSLNYLDLKAIITQPDKPVGRKQIITPTPIGIYYKKKNLGIPILKPIKYNKVSKEILQKYKPDLIIVASYGQMIDKYTIDFPKYKCLNIHGSILPKYRGAIPVQMAILNGDSYSGVSIIQMTERLDDGDIISIDKIKLTQTETTAYLMNKLSILGSSLLKKSLLNYLQGNISPTPQDNSKATYCYTKYISKKNAQLSPDMTKETIDRKVRAYTPWPIAYIIYKDLRIQILKTGKMINEKIDETFKIINNRLYYQAINGAIEITHIKIAGKKEWEVSKYINQISQIFKKHL